MDGRSFSFIAVLVTIPVFVAALPAGSAEEARWATLGGSFQRSGLSQSQGPVAGGIRWQFETGGAVVGSVTVGADGQIHIACEDGKLYTLDSDGKPLWVLNINGPLLSRRRLARMAASMSEARTEDSLPSIPTAG